MKGPFSQVGNNVPHAATDISSRAQLLTEPVTTMNYTLRVVNSSAATAYVIAGDGAVVATSANGRPVGANSTAIFNFPSTASHVAVILGTAAATGTVNLALGLGNLV